MKDLSLSRRGKGGSRAASWQPAPTVVPSIQTCPDGSTIREPTAAQRRLLETRAAGLEAYDTNVRCPNVPGKLGAPVINIRHSLEQTLEVVLR